MQEVLAKKRPGNFTPNGKNGMFDEIRSLLTWTRIALGSGSLSGRHADAMQSDSSKTWSAHTGSAVSC